MQLATIDNLPPETRERVLRLQQMQNTLQTLVSQRQRLELELGETERALKGLETVQLDMKIYKSIGTILVEREKGSVVKELGERKELLELRLKTLGGQEDKARKRVAELQKALQKELGIESPPQ